MRVEYHPALEKELLTIVEYYNQCSLGLGLEFLNEFERQILTIAAMPMQSQRLAKHHHSVFAVLVSSDKHWFHLLLR